MEETLMLIKPDAVEARAIGKIVARVEQAGFAISAMRMVRLSKPHAAGFYREHREKPFFNDLLSFMTRGPIVALRLCRVDAVTTLRTLVGATDARKAEPGTIRAEFGTDNQENAVHASDSPTSAARETAFFFSQLDTPSQE